MLDHRKAEMLDIIAVLALAGSLGFSYILLTAKAKQRKTDER
ncbi:hypothetical protein HWB05_gp023 [Streptomyces phage BRock]|uniref:Uncharacterized protein n=1 Tax=Streptomyces phage BRock TaxID=1913591 RepID=A0A1J0GVT7_9CAUD|nr:hypothetical protein HWB05_gp023 [Streptomyces phage BRock]APC46285.1 hypothetical protein [Streptomyces phage BRock]